MAMMDHALDECRQTIGVLSSDYLESVFATAEWTAAYRQALLGRERGFVPIRVAKCDPAPLLGPLAYIDLVDLTEDEARRRLLHGLGPGVARQPSRPEFPGQPGC
jgi:TIR domain